MLSSCQKDISHVQVRVPCTGVPEQIIIFISVIDENLKIIYHSRIISVLLFSTIHITVGHAL